VVGSDIVVVNAGVGCERRPHCTPPARTPSRDLDRHYTISATASSTTVTTFLRCAGRSVLCVAECGGMLSRCRQLPRRYTTSGRQRNGDRGVCGACGVSLAADPSHQLRCGCPGPTEREDSHFNCSQRYKLVYRRPSGCRTGPLTVVDVYQSSKDLLGVPFHVHTAPQVHGAIRRMPVRVRIDLARERRGGGRTTPQVSARPSCASYFNADCIVS
jgi:hypothetical protein